MKKWILIVIVVGMVGWAVYDFIDSSQKSAEEAQGADTSGVEEVDAEVGLNVGNLAPDFELKTLTGDVVRLSDLRGEKVMINFWATWCPPCRAEMPDMEKFHQEKDVVILAVNLTNTEKSIEDVESFSEEYHLTFPILMDSDLAVSTVYAISPIPTSFMVDSNGIISSKAFGAMNYDMMVQAFEKME